MSELKIDKEELENVRGELAGLFERLDEGMDEENFDLIMCSYNMARAILEFTVMMGKSKDCFISYGMEYDKMHPKSCYSDSDLKHPLLSDSEAKDEDDILKDENLDNMIDDLRSLLKRAGK